MFKYFPRRSTGSPPSSTDSEAAPAPDTPSETAKPIRLDTLPSEGVTPRRFLTAAGEWIDLSQLGPVDWGAVSDNFSKLVAHLQPQYHEGHTAREDG